MNQKLNCKSKKKKRRNLQFLEDNIGENQDDFGLAEDFLGTTPKA